jgi:hypothetical protein
MPDIDPDKTGQTGERGARERFLRVPTGRLGRPTLDERAASGAMRTSKFRHTGPQVRPWAGPRINSGRCPWHIWVPAFAGKTRVFCTDHLDVLRREVAFSCEDARAILAGGQKVAAIVSPVRLGPLCQGDSRGVLRRCGSARARMDRIALRHGRLRTVNLRLGRYALASQSRRDSQEFLPQPSPVCGGGSGMKGQLCQRNCWGLRPEPWLSTMLTSAGPRKFIASASAPLMSFGSSTKKPLPPKASMTRS